MFSEQLQSFFGGRHGVEIPGVGIEFVIRGFAVVGQNRVTRFDTRSPVQCSQLFSILFVELHGPHHEVCNYRLAKPMLWRCSTYGSYETHQFKYNLKTEICIRLFRNVLVTMLSKSTILHLR